MQAISITLKKAFDKYNNLKSYLIINKIINEARNKLNKGSSMK